MVDPFLSLVAAAIVQAALEAAAHAAIRRSAASYAAEGNPPHPRRARPGGGVRHLLWPAITPFGVIDLDGDVRTLLCQID